ncbi:MAG: hypothetical protein R6W76_02045 [Caldilinea sp.]
MSKLTRIQLAAMDWPWRGEDPEIAVILTSDEQLLGMAADPDLLIDKIHPHATTAMSLRQLCQQGADLGASTLRIAYDYFFGGSTRNLYPDTTEFQAAIKRVHDVAKSFGLLLEPSILSPLELGIGYQERTGESGEWMHYREGLRDPYTGHFSVSLWQQTRWTNNKGPTPVTLKGIRAFAFKEERIRGTSFFAVRPDEIVELTTPEMEVMPSAGARVEMLEGGVADERAMFLAKRVRVHGHGGPTGLDRVLVVLIYETLEMDYFSPNAPAFLSHLADQYHTRGISLGGLYSDEMHIQQDWSYHSHMDTGQFVVRYVSKGFQRAFAQRYGQQYADFARYLVYFTSHQHDFLPTHEPKLPAQHVFGATTADIHRTLLFRRNYYDFLEQSVVRLMLDAKHELERHNERVLDTFYHATWAESPTCDFWAVGGVPESWSPEEHRRRYDYTPDFVWSNTVHQAASACSNYFAWNDFLSGGNNDTAEGGFSDRNYYGRALACSLAALNQRPLAQAYMWGMPDEVRERMTAVTQAFGAGGHPAFRSVCDYASRQIEVLMLYPQDLVAVDERFGSWMVQYGYANYITADKLIEHGAVTSDGRLDVSGARYTTLCVLYEPFPAADLLKLIQKFVEHGGTIIWSSTPPMLTRDGEQEVASWMDRLFGIECEPVSDPLGLPLPARWVHFSNTLSSVEPMAILTDFVVDRVFPVRPVDAEAEIVATIQSGGSPQSRTIGTCKRYASGGQAIYLGFRPRDDQAASTGVEVRTWFEILDALDTYPSSTSGTTNDNPTVRSRTTEYIACTFPNGAVAIASHYRHHEEAWPGGFFRDPRLDEQIIRDHPLPDDIIELNNWTVNGQSITYHGRHTLIWRRDHKGQLVGFAGCQCTGIEIDGQRWSWSEQPVDIAWHPLQPEHMTNGYQPLYRIWCGSAGKVRVSLGIEDNSNVEIWLGAKLPTIIPRSQDFNGRAGYGDRQLALDLQNGLLSLDVNAELTGHWLYVVRCRL